MHEKRTNWEMEDLQCIRRFLAGEAAAFETLYRKYYRRVYAVCYRMLGDETAAEDAVQEVFLAIYGALPRFRGEADFLTWAYRIAVRRCLRMAKQIHVAIDEEYLPDPAAHAAHEQTLTNAVVQQALGRLSPVYRTVLALRYFEGLSAREIAHAMASSVPVVKMRLHRAKKSLAQALQGAVTVGIVLDMLEHQTHAALPPLAPKTAEGAMYAKFCHVLQTVGAPKMLSFSLTTLFAGAAMVVMLLTGGVFLYTSAQSEQFSTLPATHARAVLTDVDAPLALDTRLQRRARVEACGDQVGEILRAMSEQTGVNLVADLQIAHQRLFLKLRGIPAARALSLIREHLALEWVVTGSGRSAVYQLSLTKRAQANIAAARATQRATVRQEAIQNLTNIVDMLSTRTYYHREIASVSPHIARDVRRIAQDARDPALWKFQYWASPLMLLNQAVVAHINTNGSNHLESEQLTAEQRRVMQHYTNFYRNDKPDPGPYDFELRELDDGGVDLYFKAKFAGSSLGALYEPWMLRTLQEDDDITLEEMTCEAAAMNPHYRDERLQRIMRLKVKEGTEQNWPQGKERVMLNLPEIMQQIAKQTRFQVIGDYFTLTVAQYGANQSSHRSNSYAFPLRSTLAEWLAVLDRGYNIAWTISKDNVLQLRHRDWMFLRDAEPPQELVNEFVHTLRTRRAFTLAQAGKLAMLDDLQFRGTKSAIQERMQYAEVLKNALMPYDNELLYLREYLAIYGSIPPAQRTAMSAPAGIPVAPLSEDQRRCVATVISKREMDYGKHLSEDEILRKQLILRVYETDTTFDKMTDCWQQGIKHMALVKGRVPGGNPYVIAHYLVIDIIDQSNDKLYRACLAVEKDGQELRLNPKDLIVNMHSGQ